MFRIRKHLALLFFFFFFNDTATTEIYTLSLHDALPICRHLPAQAQLGDVPAVPGHLRLVHRLCRRLSAADQEPVPGGQPAGLCLAGPAAGRAVAALWRLAGRQGGRSEERRVGEEGRSRWAPYH